MLDYGLLKLYKEYEHYRKESIPVASGGGGELRRSTSQRQMIVDGQDLVDAGTTVSGSSGFPAATFPS